MLLCNQKAKEKTATLTFSFKLLKNKRFVTNVRMRTDASSLLKKLKTSRKHKTLVMETKTPADFSSNIQQTREMQTCCYDLQQRRGGGEKTNNPPAEQPKLPLKQHPWQVRVSFKCSASSNKWEYYIL